MGKWSYFFAGLIGATVIYVFIILSIVFVDVIKEKKMEAIIIKEIGPFNCEVFNDVKNTFDENIIINDGKLYNISLGLKYSNEQNCMEIDDKFIKTVVNNYYIDYENNVYTIDESGLKRYTVSGRIPSYMMGEGIIMAHSYGLSSEYKYYVLKTDGKIYDVHFTREFHFENGTGTYRYNVSKEELYKEFEGEIIKSFDMENDLVNYVVTDKSIYVNKVTNMECYEYADVDCLYELNKNDTLTESMDNILYINHFDNVIKYIAYNTIYSFES